MQHYESLSVLMARATRFLPVFLAVVPLILRAASPLEPTYQTPNPVPSPELAPSEVVRIQVEALRENGPLNDGIELTYRFASPGNKRSTGPLDRFIEMVRSAPHDRLLNHLDADYGRLAVAGEEAYQTVVITDNKGDELAYVWVLSRQGKGAFKDCWMTDAVIPAQRPVQRRLTQHFGTQQMGSAASG